MKLLSIDPGNRRSAWMLFDWQMPIEHGIHENEQLLYSIANSGAEHLAIEYMHPRGMAMSQESMDTQFWAGRFAQEFSRAGRPWTGVDRKDVKMHVCCRPNATDANIRRALIDLYGGDDEAIGGTKCPTCHGNGTKGFEVVECGGCAGTGRVPAVRGGDKKCGWCGGKCTRRGARARCPDCNGSQWLHPPGPLSGIAADVWSALAIAVTWWNTMRPEIERATA